MKNDGKIGKEYVRKEISEEQFPNLEVMQACQAMLPAAILARAPASLGGLQGPHRQETRAFMTEVLLLTYSQTKRQVSSDTAQQSLCARPVRYDI